MKIGSLVELTTDAQDVVSFFEGVNTIEQMISRLERIKKRDAEEFLYCISSLETSINILLNDQLELGGSIDSERDTDESDDDILDSDLAALDFAPDHQPFGDGLVTDPPTDSSAPSATPETPITQSVTPEEPKPPVT